SPFHDPTDEENKATAIRALRHFGEMVNNGEAEDKWEYFYDHLKSYAPYITDRGFTGLLDIATKLYKKRRGKRADAIEGEVVPKSVGNWKLWVFPADEVQYGQYGEIKRPIPASTKMYYVGDKAKALDILNQNYGPLTREQEDQVLSRGFLNLEDVVVRVTNLDYTKPITLPKRKLDVQAAEVEGSGERLEDEAREFLEGIAEVSEEAQKAFMEDSSNQQRAQDEGWSME